MALQGQAIVVGWQIYSLTGSTLMLGLTGLAEAAPALFGALFAGHIVDNSQPRKVLTRCLMALSLNTFLLLLLGGGLIKLPHDTALVYMLYVGIFISGLVRSFIIPSNFSLFSLIIKRADVSQAASWQAAALQVSMIVGPSLAGILLSLFGTLFAWSFVFAMMAIALIFSFLIRANHPPRGQERAKAWASIREGWAFLLQRRDLLSIMSLDMLAVLFGGAIAILPAFSHEVLHMGAEGLGILRAAPAIGAVLSAIYFGIRPMQRITAWRLMVVVSGFGISMIGFGLSTSLLSAILFLALSGCFDSVSMIIRGTLVQLLTPDSMRGRISSVNSMFIISSNEIGAFQSGLAATVFGLVPSIIIGGCATLFVVAGVAALSPSFRRLHLKT